MKNSMMKINMHV